MKIEVKHGRDRQSEAQKKYQADIEKAGGVYYVAKTFDEFYRWYEDNFESQPIEKRNNNG